ERDVALESDVADVAGYTDHGEPGFTCRRADLDPLANRIRSGPQAPRHRLIDDDDERVLALIVLVELAAGDDRNPHGAKVVRQDASVTGRWRLAGGELASLHRDAAVAVTSANR